MGTTVTIDDEALGMVEELAEAKEIKNGEAASRLIKTGYKRRATIARWTNVQEKALAAEEREKKKAARARKAAKAAKGSNGESPKGKKAKKPKKPKAAAEEATEAAAEEATA